MKIIEALKQVKDLTRKASDLTQKVKQHCADLDFETPVYPDQRDQIGQWIQAHRDVCREILRLKKCLSKTNSTVMVDITIDGNTVSRTIQEWIFRKKELIALEKSIWDVLSNRGLRDSQVQGTSGQTIQTKVRYYYDPKQKDHMTAFLNSEPALIDSKLEIVNAITDLLE